MKKVLLGLLCGMLAACSNNDDGPGPNPILEQIPGTYQLSELRISPEQDIDEDGTFTDNVLDELPCISAQIIMRADNTWSFTGNDVIITTITGGLFKFFCSDEVRNNQGEWDLQGNVVRLGNSTGIITEFQFNETQETLTNIIGEALPGLQAEVYTRN